MFHPSMYPVPPEPKAAHSLGLLANRMIDQEIKPAMLTTKGAALQILVE